jgi:hypothetical protein
MVPGGGGGLLGAFDYPPSTDKELTREVTYDIGSGCRGQHPVWRSEPS